MKKLTALIAFMLISCAAIFSQSLANSTWQIYDTTGTLFLYFHFATDTASYSTDNISYTDISLFAENGNNFSIIDLASGPCPSDTGKYTFAIQNDTLIFTEVGDSCSSRANTLTVNTWKRLPAGLVEGENRYRFEIFPNPASDRLVIRKAHGTIDCQYTVMNAAGKQCLEGKLVNERTELSIENLVPGLYFIRIEGEDQLLKLVVR